jgi:U4/U6 small nuclear ribonucleoprotein PRP31
MNFDFNKPEEEYIDGDEVIGLGVLGSKEGSGRLRVVASQQKVRLTQKQQKKYKGRLMGGGGAASGLASSMAFTPIQGLELGAVSTHGTETMGDKGRSGLDSYFSEFSGFRSLQKKPGT